MGQDSEKEKKLPSFLDELDCKIISELQSNLPLVERPFARLAEDLGVSEEKVIDRLKRLSREGILKRIAPIVSQEKTGFRNNAMVVWQVPEEKCDKVGSQLAEFDFVSHCYRRPTAEGWPYQLFTVVHATSGQDRKNKFEKLESAAREAAGETGEVKFKVLKTQEKLKKQSLSYF
ncbi:Lrp/AsnC family transcriptional regulator [Halarsenatibacter silvermanii]|uniref:siroheme decarboxylase n=1 Tax=Halarsenatibacter silvermanii TaxID=321763 RepID=A0A1G9Q338_9FIRM|nr:AsnC family transcriptional regulator [Halarsenatibacter silvermanii]SDM04755.1 DNA-binding transcriptional regulator, Lrp family [Halarsenatibacter silvermanii]